MYNAPGVKFAIPNVPIHRNKEKFRLFCSMPLRLRQLSTKCNYATLQLFVASQSLNIQNFLSKHFYRTLNIRQLYFVCLYAKSAREVFENEKLRTERFLVFDSRHVEKSRSDVYNITSGKYYTSLLDFSESAFRILGLVEISTIENENISC